MGSAMNRRQFIRSAALGAAGAWGAGLAGCRPSARAENPPGARRPNIIVILTDDMGSADVGFQGCKDIPTPNLDSLARTGVRCEAGYVSHPFCSPTRAGLMTGRYQQRFGHENNPVYDPKDTGLGLPLGEVTLPQVLKQAGYVTGMVGKWHLGAAPHFHPLKRGFDEYYGFVGGGHDYFKAAAEGEAREYLIPIESNGKPAALTEYLTDALSGAAAAMVRRHRDRPFFLYLAYNAPHTPLQAPEKYLGRFASIDDPRRRSYAAMVSAVDDGVGLVLAALRETGLERDTLIFFLSDNGGPVGQASNGSSNAPLANGKGSVFEGGIRVPFVVRWPSRLPAGAVYSEPVICLDILPTAAAAAGAAMPAGRGIDGVNLLPHLAGENRAPPHETLFWRAGGGAAWAVRTGRYKLLKRAAGAEPALYDLETDIGEWADLAAAQPERVRQMQKRYDDWNGGLVAPLWQSPRPAAKKAAPAGKQK